MRDQEFNYTYRVEFRTEIIEVMTFQSYNPLSEDTLERLAKDQSTAPTTTDGTEWHEIRQYIFDYE